MFVFKAAVVGAGTMGGQIAQTIAAAGIPVVLKDIDDALVQAGLDEARNVTTGQIGKLARRARSPPSRQASRSSRSSGGSRARPPTRTSATSTSWSRPCPSGWRSSRPCSPSSTRPRPDTRAGLQHLLAVDHGDRRSDAATGQGRRLSLLLPGIDHAADRDRRGRGDVRRDGRRGRHVRAGDPQAAITCAEVPGFVVNRILNSSSAEVWREQEQKGLSIKKIDEGLGAAGILPLGPTR